MPKKNLWITLTLLNLCVVALLGAILRTKFLFPIPFIDYRYMLSAHSHFAFGGWVTLTLMILYIDNLLSYDQQQKKIYQFILWGILASSYGMVFTFPFQGYAPLSIFFSTLFIFFTYIFAWVFISDLRKIKINKSVSWLSITAVLCLVVSSIGPFTLAYTMASGKGDANLMRDAVYTFLHFQYNGFFTLSVFALLFHNKLSFEGELVKKKMFRFTVPLCLSVLPSLFLSLLWHYDTIIFRSIALAGCLLILLSLIFFVGLLASTKSLVNTESRLSRLFIFFCITGFVIKMLLNMGTIFPSLGNAVYGYRPIIIGFLHLVFLGLVTFYILSHFIEKGVFSFHNRFAGFSLGFFTVAILINELILLVNGIGLLLKRTNDIYPWLLWAAALGLFLGALLIVVSRMCNLSGSTLKPGKLITRDQTGFDR
jgi:hypothetical protein